jgi:hypothetical protein
MLVMGYDGRPVCLSAKEIGTEGRSELQRLEALVCRPGSLAFGAMVPHVIHLHEADAPPRQLELILGRKVHLLRSVDWQSDIAVRLADREPLSRAFEANLRLLTEHPGSMGAVDDQIEQLRAEAMQVLKLFDFDFPMLPAIASLAA